MARDNNAAATASVQKRLGASLPGNLWDAARAGNPQQVESLIHQGTPVDARDNEGRTALMLAAMHGHTTTAQKLLALDLTPGSVTPLGLLNDRDHAVRFCLDRDFDGGRIGVHPNDNTATVWLSVRALLALLRDRGTEIELVEI